MRIAKVDYNPETNSIEVYVTGCKLRCKGCHNYQLQSFVAGTPWRDHLSALTRTFIPRLMIMGGEPQDQDRSAMLEFLDLMGEFYPEIWVFTGYEEVDPAILARVNRAKVGPYMEDREGWTYTCADGCEVHLASNNQTVGSGWRCMK